MEIIIAIIALAVGCALGYVLCMATSRKPHSAVDLEARLAERDAAMQREWQQRLDEKEANFNRVLEEREASRLKELAAKQEIIVAREESMRREKEALEQGYVQRLHEQERLFNEAIARKDSETLQAVEKLELRHKQEIEKLEERNKEITEMQDRRHAEAMEALKARFSESAAAMSEQLRNATEQMLKQRQDEFALSSGEKINNLLQPLEQTIRLMRETVAENTTRHSELGGQLDSGLKTLLSQTAAARASADKLANALRSNNRVQGEWGETILRELLESQGLTEGVHFDLQTPIADARGLVKNEEGRSARPDVILHLDRGRELIVDSKVSLAAYLDYVNSETDEQRAEALKAHVASLQRHVDELARKDYSAYIKAPKTKIDYVIMFVPNTTALYLATTHRHDLWRKAMEKNVYIADEQTLYAAMKIVSMTWSQIQQAQNHEKVFELAQTMMERVGQFIKQFEAIGTKLDEARKCFEDGKKKLVDDGQSIPKTCRQLIKLGAKAGKNAQAIPGEYFEGGLLGE